MDAEAIVAPVRVKPHPNADRVQLADVMGYQVVVGKDVQEGALGLLFPPDAQLGEAFAKANKLLKADGGYFSANRRVTMQRFRGERSEAFWIPLSSLEFTGKSPDELKAYHAVADWGGVEICRRWINPETLRAQAAGQSRGIKGSAGGEVPWFRKHHDTEQLRHATASDFPAGSRIFITEKLHGTSHRVGMVPAEARTGLLARIGARIADALGYAPAHRWRFVSGSRNVVLKAGVPDRFHGGTFRDDACAVWASLLRPGEVVYGELVGYSGPGKPIMATHNAADSSVEAVQALAALGPIRYAYGQTDGTAAFYAYRIVQHGPDGHALELSWEQLEARCRELGISTVPLLDHMVSTPHANIDEVLVDIRESAEAYDNEDEPWSTLDTRHPMEGVCVRVERPNGTVRHFKHKTFAFCELEGITASRPGHVDVEEAS